MAPIILPRVNDQIVTLSVGSIVAIVEGAIIFTMMVYLIATRCGCGMCGRGGSGKGGRGRSGGGFW